jgi:O-antigen ligase
VLIALNLMVMIATGNRTGVLTLVAMFPIFLFVFRRRLGPKRITTFALGGILALFIAGAVAVTFTDFDRMFSRMEKVTETQEGIPSTRAKTWTAAIAKIKMRPWFGYGPYYPSVTELVKSGALNVEFEDLGTIVTAYDPYPHSLYLYLLRTVGIVGLIPVVGFFLWTWWSIYVVSRERALDEYSSALLRVGFLLIPAFLIAQITLEFNRDDTMDYAQFIFALMGLVVGVGDRKPVSRRETAADEEPVIARPVNGVHAESRCAS